MRCDHRFELVGYRGRMLAASELGPGCSLMDAVLVCSRCTKEHLAGVTQMLPAPIIDTGRWDHAAALRHSNPVAGGPNDVAYWSSRSPGEFEPLDALGKIADAVESLGFGPDHSVGKAVFREVRALRAYIAGGWSWWR